MKSLASITLGSRQVRYDERDAALYALAVGARADELEMVYERDLQVLPTFATALGMWAASATATAGGYDENKVLHVGQELTIKRRLPRTAAFDTDARVLNVYDKGYAALVEILVESDFFEATYRMYVPGEGGWGGERGPSVNMTSLAEVDWATEFSIPDSAAALYRLTGDLHPVHIDPDVARAQGLRRPILHGLCTLGIVAREIAALSAVRPQDLIRIEANLVAPVYPGQKLMIVGNSEAGTADYDAKTDDKTVLFGRAHFVETS